MRKNFKVALAGNPNCGKTCIFNALTGARQHVGNYPGVTVESKSGRFRLDDVEIELVDLPGVYSLSSSSPEEAVVFRELTKPGIDLIVNVIDSTIPQRSLYLTTQLAELHIPMLMAFNMSDDARRKGLKFDIPKLERYFGYPIVQTVGNSVSGVISLKKKLAETLASLDDHGVPMLSYGGDVDEAVSAVAERIDALNVERYRHIPARFFAIKLLEKDSSAMSIEDFRPAMEEVEVQIRHLRDKHAIEADTFMADRRYAMLAGACRDTISSTHEKRREISDRIDTVMTNKYLGLPLFLLIMFLTFLFSFNVAEPLMGWIESFFGWLGGAVEGAWSEEHMPVLRDLVIRGVIDGVGGVLVFLPQILLLFFAIAILEESGYMARAAFVMDGLMRRFGLQGKSFVPLVLGFGCTVPAIMATRTIESERDRRITVMVLPLMSCSARLPIHSLIIGAFFAAYSKVAQASMFILVYIIGILIALIAARVMKSTLFKGDGEVYLMELPPYRMPSLKSLLLHMWDRSRMYLHKAGTIILFTSVVLYICNTYPKKSDFSVDYDTRIEEAGILGEMNAADRQALRKSGLLDEGTLAEVEEKKAIPREKLAELLTENGEGEKVFGETAAAAATALSPAERGAVLNVLRKADRCREQIDNLNNARLSEQMAYTVSGRVGKFIEPVFKPLGFDWKISTACIGALAAKEVFVSQMGILYSEGDEADEESEPLRQKMAATYTPLQGFCIMIFCLLSIPCLATLAIIRRELNSWWAAVTEAIGLFLLAYLVTLIVYQAGLWLRIGTEMLG